MKKWATYIPKGSPWVSYCSHEIQSYGTPCWVELEYVARAKWRKTSHHFQLLPHTIPFIRFGVATKLIHIWTACRFILHTAIDWVSMSNRMLLVSLHWMPAITLPSPPGDPLWVLQSGHRLTNHCGQHGTQPSVDSSASLCALHHSKLRLSAVTHHIQCCRLH